MSCARLAAALSLATAVALPAQANLLANGGFEFPALGSGYAAYDQGQTIGAWTVVGTGNPVASVLALHTTYQEYSNTLSFSAYEGVVSLDLTGSGHQGANGVQQSVATTAGAVYALSFQVGNQDSAFGGYGAGSVIEVFIDAVSAGVFANSDENPADVNWKGFSLTFTAASASTTIAFINATAAYDFMTGLDAVSLVEVPEPAGMALLLWGAVATIGGLRRRRTTPRA